MNIQHRITSEVYFVTDTVVDWVDVFTRPVYKHIVVDSLEHCQQNKGGILPEKAKIHTILKLLKLSDNF